MRNHHLRENHRWFKVAKLTISYMLGEVSGLCLGGILYQGFQIRLRRLIIT